MNTEDILFPHEEIREIQHDLITDVVSCLEKKKNLIAHAPTGLGKTAAVLSPALQFALDHDLTVFFLTSRHTQHKIAVETLQAIKKKHGKNIVVADLIGKQWMCAQPGATALYSNEFTEYCKKLVEDYKCEYYVNARKKTKVPTLKAEQLISELEVFSPQHTEAVFEASSEKKLCPYEIGSLLAEKAKVVIADYFTIFHPSISNTFFAKTKKELSRSIIIVDEAHNLPQRARELMTTKLTMGMVERAIHEAKKYSYEEVEVQLRGIKDILQGMSSDLTIEQDERLVEKEEFISQIKAIGDYDEMLAAFSLAGDDIREQQKQSSVGSIASFLETWLGEDKGFTRLIAKVPGKREEAVTLQYNCMDPRFITKEVIENAYATIVMSGTLTPTAMYRDLLGFENALEKEYKSPFPEKNRLTLVVPETTTKFTKRNEQEFKKIATACNDIVESVPGNSAIFFPSYYVRDQVKRNFDQLCKKTTFSEEPGMSKQEKTEMLENFKGYKDQGAVLLGAASGSFGEGIDLPGDLLKGVVVVGIPLNKPNLDTKALINYYQEKFGKGWEYAYIYPAIIKSLQNAGRCIRSKDDKGVMVFLDERYAWQNYLQCFPPDYDIKVTKLYKSMIKAFFQNHLR